ncbi:hypothetical protein J5069_04360 [Candidatus Symbiopectobacterium sp. NZEC127]|uniref:hypothetical protein n=2 Tax=unclassified Symbiopectobacterium TaxID=2794573 RepID=UPI00222789B6|nr:hypothetical protein [Candidatus Symbiopectobacterium sp. NZEC127]MCW2485127.1 hypothetical protein [Candidatus Symbiopectobacterium sp. NZEC127]
MLPAVTSESIALLPLSSRARQHVALTPAAVMSQTHLRQHGQLIYRYQDALFWCEHEDVSSLHSRVNYLNKVVNHIRQTMPNRDQPLTLLSLGAGGLLMESFIHAQLQCNGYQDIHWRVIDIEYGPDGTQQCLSHRDSLDAFAAITSGKLAVYGSDQHYFNTFWGGNGATSDRSRGATVLLAIDPPTSSSQVLGIASLDPNSMSVKGRPVEDIADANCLYLIASEPEYKTQVHHAMAALARGDHMMTLGSILKCYVNKFGGCEVLSTQSPSSLMMKEACVPLLAQEKTTQASTSTLEMTLSDIRRAVERYVAAMADENGLYFAVCCVSDYDVSLTRLRDYIVDNPHSSLLATLEMNATRIENHP